jgi:hypothetical protein
MNLKKFMKEMVKMAMNNGGVNLGGNGAQQFFDGMARANHNQAHNIAVNHAMDAMNTHMNSINNFTTQQMMHGPKF